MNEKLSRRAREIILRLHYITIASVSADGQPWNTPVFFAPDENLNFYWGSHKDAQHSQNIRATGKVFLAIYDSTIEPGKGEGVYIQANAVELTDLAEITKAHQLIDSRHIVPYWKLEQVHGDTPIRLYKAVPTRAWMNDEGSRDGHYIDIRTEIKLA